MATRIFSRGTRSRPSGVEVGASDVRLRSVQSHCYSASEGIPIGSKQPREWVKDVETFKKSGWKDLTVSERKRSLYFLYTSQQDKHRFEEVVQYVIETYPKSCIENLDGDGRSLLPALSAPLAVKVLKFHSSEALTLKHVPSLMVQGIPSQKLKKLLVASQDKERERQSGEVPALFEAVHPSAAEDEEEEDFLGIVQRSESSPTADVEFVVRADSAPKQQETRRLVGRFSRYMLLHSQSVTTVEELQESVEDMLQNRCCSEGCKYLDNCLHGVLSCNGAHVNLNECSTNQGTLLHTAARYGLTESAKEILKQGYYSMLLEDDKKVPNTWPLVYAVRHKHWTTVKVILDTLNFSQRQAQIRAVLKKIKYKDVVQNVSMYKKPWWPLSILHRPDVKERLQNEGRVLLLRAVLDTSVKGYEVDPSILFDTDGSSTTEEQLFDGHGREHTDSAGDTGQGRPVSAGNDRSRLDGNDRDTTNKSLYRLISERDIEELKKHPSFTAIVQHRWRHHRYNYWHGLLSVFYLVYLILFTVALALAAESPDPRVYSRGLDFLRLFFEIVSFLYLFSVLVVDIVLYIDGMYTHYRSQKNSFEFFVEWVTLFFIFELLRYSSTLLIIPLRIANDPHQWWMVSLAIILSGLRLFHYATVFPFMGRFVGMLILIAEHDLPRLFGVFAVINFSFGTGLYFALVEPRNNGNIDVANENVTSDIYGLWLTGVQMVIEGSVLTYIGNDAFNLPGRVIYWLFVFCVTVAFAAVLIAQFQTSFRTLSDRASMEALLKKSEIMHKMDRFAEVFFCRVHQDKSSKPHGWIRRKALDDSENLDARDYVLAELSQQVKLLRKNLDEVLSTLKTNRTINADVKCPTAEP